jgi:hypothetical protein
MSGFGQKRWLLSAIANFRFSNRALLSRVETPAGLEVSLVGVWVTLLYAVGRDAAGTLQALVGRVGRAMLWGALEAQRKFAASSRTIVHTVNAETKLSSRRPG